MSLLIIPAHLSLLIQEGRAEPITFRGVFRPFLSCRFQNQKSQSVAKAGLHTPPNRFSSRVSFLDRFLSRPASESPPLEGIRLVIGLGNPGPEYERTRHNIGFELVDRLALDHKLKWTKEHRFRSKTAGQGTCLILAKPLTYMNLSGNAVARLMRHYGLTVDQILVVYDDISLPPGGLRFRANGSAGGHNGIKSLIEYLGTEKFPRLRIGIGSTAENEILTDYVLGRFSEEEWDKMEKVLAIAVDGVNCALSAGLQQAMNQCNRRS
jgi:PTH1 family peptidyl-tRNA hydrolase